MPTANESASAVRRASAPEGIPASAAHTRASATVKSTSIAIQSA
jgi:hypothetical protein